MDFPENRIHKIPAEIHPAEMRIKYKALVDDTSGKGDQKAVNKNHKPGRKNKNNGVILLSEANRESDSSLSSDSGLCRNDDPFSPDIPSCWEFVTLSPVEGSIIFG